MLCHQLIISALFVAKRTIVRCLDRCVGTLLAFWLATQRVRLIQRDQRYVFHSHTSFFSKSTVVLPKFTVRHCSARRISQCNGYGYLHEHGPQTLKSKAYHFLSWVASKLDANKRFCHMYISCNYPSCIVFTRHHHECELCAHRSEDSLHWTASGSTLYVLPSHFALLHYALLSMNRMGVLQSFYCRHVV